MTDSTIGQNEKAERVKTYFDAASGSWQVKASDNSATYSTIQHRYNTALSVLEEMSDAKRFLDLGCGTGQLVLAAAGKKVAATGIDIAEGMINECEANLARQGGEADFICGSFFDLDLPESAFDVISAMGFIEYITMEQLDGFFDRCRQLLRPGGAIVVGSRNRLFNLHSLNDFTRVEIELGTLDMLANEAVVYGRHETQDTLWPELRDHERAYAQPDSLPNTEILINNRMQFTPAELMALQDPAVYRLRTSFRCISMACRQHWWNLSPICILTSQTTRCCQALATRVSFHTAHRSS